MALRKQVAVAAVAFGLSVGSLAVAQEGKAKGKAPKGDVKRGEYLVKTGGCGDCHTPFKFDAELGMPVPDMSRMLSGHPAGGPDPAGEYAKPNLGVTGPTGTSFLLPFGVVYAPNLTSDATGIGGWTEEAFVKALRTGRHMGLPNGRPIMPPMPWMNMAGMTDQDLKAIFAYLKSTPPVKNEVPSNKVPDEVIKGMDATLTKMMSAKK